MTDRELQKMLGALGEEPVPKAPRVDDAAIVDAMVKATRPPARRGRWVALLAAAAIVLLASGLLGAKALAPSGPASVAHVHGQSGDVMVVAAKGSGSPVDQAGRQITAGDRVVTLGEGQAVVAMAGATAAVGPRSELVVASPREPVVMRVGSARFDVSKRDASSPFRVRASDVDITVYGTSFTVAVDGPRVRVTVLEGVVGVRAPDAAEIKLSAGQSWPASDPPAPASSANASAPVEGPPVVPTKSGAADRPTIDPTPGPPRHEATPGTPSAKAPSAAAATTPDATSLGDQNELLAKAAEARRKGDAAGEKRALDAFVKKFADAPGLHDAVAAKMRAAARSGDSEGAAREARGYLARFPDGPLRDEALSLIARATKR